MVFCSSTYSSAPDLTRPWMKVGPLIRGGLLVRRRKGLTGEDDPTGDETRDPRDPIVRPVVKVSKTLYKDRSLAGSYGRNYWYLNSFILSSRSLWRTGPISCLLTLAFHFEPFRRTCETRSSVTGFDRRTRPRYLTFGGLSGSVVTSFDKNNRPFNETVSPYKISKYLSPLHPLTSDNSLCLGSPRTRVLPNTHRTRVTQCYRLLLRVSMPSLSP